MEELLYIEAYRGKSKGGMLPQENFEIKQTILFVASKTITYKANILQPELRY